MRCGRLKDRGCGTCMRFGYLTCPSMRCRRYMAPSASSKPAENCKCCVFWCGPVLVDNTTQFFYCFSAHTRFFLCSLSLCLIQLSHSSSFFFLLHTRACHHLSRNIFPCATSPFSQREWLCWRFILHRFSSTLCKGRRVAPSSTRTPCFSACGVYPRVTTSRCRCATKSNQRIKSPLFHSCLRCVCV